MFVNSGDMAPLLFGSSLSMLVWLRMMVVIVAVHAFY